MYAQKCSTISFSNHFGNVHHRKLNSNLIGPISSRKVSLHCPPKRSFALRISSENVTKSVENCGFGHIY